MSFSDFPEPASHPSLDPQRIHSQPHDLVVLLHMCSCVQSNTVIWLLVHKSLTLSNDIQTRPKAPTRGLSGQNTVICMKLSIQASVDLVSLGSLSNYHNNNDNVKKQFVLRAKQLLCTCITLLSTFLWRPLHDYDVKPPNATFCEGRGHTTTKLSLSDI